MPQAHLSPLVRRAQSHSVAMARSDHGCGFGCTAAGVLRRSQLANESQREGQGSKDNIGMSVDTTGISSTREEYRAPVSIPIPTPNAEPASQAAITAPAPPSNIPRLVRATRLPHNQQGDTLEGRRPGQEGTEMRVEANEEEAPRQDDRRRSTRLTSRISRPVAERRRAASEERLRARQAAGEARRVATTQAIVEAPPPVNRHSRNSRVVVRGTRSPSTADPARRNI